MDTQLDLATIFTTHRDHFRLVPAFFDLPHIVASFISYADKEYLAHYRRKISLIPIILIAVAALYAYSFLLLYIVYAIYTMYHVIRQQTGITGMLVGKFSRLHSLWSWLAIASYAYAFLLVYDNGADEYLSSFLKFEILTVIATVFLIVTLWYFWNIPKESKSGLYYFILTSLVVVSGYTFVLFGYPFLAILVVRFVHDVTAFVFYMIHDTNRNQGKNQLNIIYRLVNFLPLPMMLVTPVVAVAVAAGISYSFSLLGITSLIIIMLGFVHYYVESFMWKKDSLHRQYIKIV